MNTELTKQQIVAALRCLYDNGIEADECDTVLQALCYIILNKEIDLHLELLKEEEGDLEELIKNKEVAL